jgi:hypothetical protein
VDKGDYSASALDALGSLSSDADLEYKSLDVTAAVLADIAAGRTSSDFRVSFTGGSGDPTSVGFDGPADPNPPQFLVVYAQ